MMNRHSTKHALLSSIMALILCFTMLLGTTYAWFTDSVTSANNKIQAGTLLLDLELYDVEAGEYASIKTSKAPIFNYDKWEPGYTDVKLLKVENEGTLALKWKATLVAENALSALANVIDVYVLPSETELAMPADRALTGYTYAGTVADFVSTLETTTVGTLEPGKAAYLGIALKMQESAGNEYQEMDLGAFDICILATQLTFEEDSLGDDYDDLASFPFTEQKVLPANASAIAFELRDQNGTKVGSAEVPAAAIDDTDAPVEVTVKATALNANVTVTTGMDASTFDVTVTNLKADNTTPVKASLRIPTGLDPATVKLYHYETEIDSTYNPTTGYVSFESTSFSPFTVVYDAESEYEAPDVIIPEGSDKPEGLPEASVVRNAEFENVELPWENYGSWSPTAGLDSKLEAAYTFSCTETAEEAKENPFAFWYCDFVVSLDKALGENQLFLGGNYGSFGWIGFHNGDLTLDANTEVELLGSVTTNPWTYADVAEFVNTFTCGVGDVNDALSGATFKVMLRLTNPEDATEFYNVATIEYTFA